MIHLWNQKFKLAFQNPPFDKKYLLIFSNGLKYIKENERNSTENSVTGISILPDPFGSLNKHQIIELWILQVK